MSSRRLLSVLILFHWLLNSCTNDGKPNAETDRKKVVQRGFYYWKNNSNALTPAEQKAMNNLGVDKLYLKFFEVRADEVFGAVPYAKTSLSADRYTHDKAVELIPTVYIRNDVFADTSGVNLDTLAGNIAFLVYKYQRERFGLQAVGEVQIDCDWTQSTKESYFNFLEALKKTGLKTISCTLRLYPYKYRDAMGIPPVDKVTLMCYNFTSPLNVNQNSIQNSTELEAYLKNTQPYPLHIDVALPLFSSMLVYQNGQFSGMITANKEIREHVRELKPMWYEVQQDLELENLFLRKGDRLKVEEVTNDKTRQAIAVIKKYLPLRDTTTVTFFHLDDTNIQQTDETLHNFYSAFVR